MPKRIHPRILAVSADTKPLTLQVTWDRGQQTMIDVSALINSFAIFRPLRTSPELFGQVQVGEYGADIVWSDDMDMSADSLWRLAQEQSGATMTADAFKTWRTRQSYTLETAAAALGVSRRMLAYYEQGSKPIPRVVALATRALDIH